MKTLDSQLAYYLDDNGTVHTLPEWEATEYLASQGGTWAYRTPEEMTSKQYEEILQQLETDR